MEFRYFADVSYKGTAYHGWQAQENAASVQATIDHAIGCLLQQKIESLGSGRTDKGVHALQQIMQFDCNSEIDCEDIANRLNAFLPEDIAIKSIKPVSIDANARFHATSRSYIYKINRRKNPMWIGLAYYFHKPLDLDAMREATDLLIGRHNFQSFSIVKTNVNNFFCDITAAHWNEENEMLDFHISSNRFLRGMVRSIVGTLLLVGQKRITLEEYKAIIESKDRKKAGISVPGAGLYLSQVVYPEHIYK